jgi:hypothetical protein
VQKTKTLNPTKALDILLVGLRVKETILILEWAIGIYRMSDVKV